MKRLSTLIVALALIVAACSDTESADTSEAADTASDTTTGETTTTTSDTAETTTTTSEAGETGTTLSPDVAATVDGTELSVDYIESLIDNGGDPIQPTLFAQFLGFAIQWSITTEDAAAEWDVTASEEEITTAADEIFEGTATQDESREDFLSSRGVTEEFLRGVAEQQVIQTAIQDQIREDVTQPSQELIEEQRASEAAASTQVCASHILVPTAEEAQEALDRLDSGEDFASVATELSQDPGSAENGGELGCGPAGQYVPAFRNATVNAPIGEVLEEPVETDFGFHIILVTDRTEPSPGDLPSDDQLVEQLQASEVEAELNEWFLEALTAAEVRVNSTYGAWVTSPQPGVVPPS